MKVNYALVYNGWCIESVREVVTTSRSTLSSTITCTHHADQRRSCSRDCTRPSRLSSRLAPTTPVRPRKHASPTSCATACSAGHFPAHARRIATTPLMPPIGTSCAHAHEFRSSIEHACWRCRRHNRGTCSLSPPPGGPRPPGATQGIRAGAEPLPAHAASSGSHAARCPCARSRNRPRASMPANQRVIQGCTRASQEVDDDRAA